MRIGLEQVRDDPDFKTDTQEMLHFRYQTSYLCCVCLNTKPYFLTPYPLPQAGHAVTISKLQDKYDGVLCFEKTEISRGDPNIVMESWKEQLLEKN